MVLLPAECQPIEVEIEELRATITQYQQDL